MALAQHLPRDVLRLWLGLGGCSIGRDGAQALARALSQMSKLERLHLDCSRCRISDLAAAGFALTLTKFGVVAEVTVAAGMVWGNS